MNEPSVERHIVRETGGHELEDFGRNVLPAGQAERFPSRGTSCLRTTAVEVGGVEPPSFKLLVGLLRAQPVGKSQIGTAHRQCVSIPAPL